MRVQKDLFCETRDGAELAVDVYLPGEEGPHSALLAFSPYGKEFQDPTLFMPRQPHASPLWNGAIEAGDIEYITDHGYAHVVGDVRGTGASGGEYRGFFDTDGRDGYDLVEWIAEQPWCDGQVGLCGRSWFGTNQLLVAAENPPSLVGAFPSGGYTDLYREVAYHGGVLNLFPYLWWNYIMDTNWVSRERSERGETAFREALEAKLEEEDFRQYPDLYQLLHYPDQNPHHVDLILNDTDNEFYRERSPHVGLSDIEVPIYLSAAWKGTHTIPAYTAYEGAEHSEHRKVMMTPPKKLERPYHEYMEEMVRWFDRLTKGETGDADLLEEPPVKMYVSGAEQWRFEDSLVLDRTEWTEYYLRNHGRLLPDPEPLAEVPPTGFTQQPLTIATREEKVSFTSGPLPEPTEFIGPVGLHLYASIDAEDTTWMARLWDSASDGERKLLGRGYLKASHRAVDEDRSEPYRPYHPHQEPEPVEPGEINRYDIEIQPIAHVFPKGHSIELTVQSLEIPMSGEPDFLIESFHLPHAETIAHEIYHTREHPSHVVMPLIPETDDEQWIEPSDPAHPGPHL